MVKSYQDLIMKYRNYAPNFERKHKWFIIYWIGIGKAFFGVKWFNKTGRRKTVSFDANQFKKWLKNLFHAKVPETSVFLELRIWNSLQKNSILKAMFCWIVLIILLANKFQTSSEKRDSLVERRKKASSFSLKQNQTFFSSTYFFEFFILIELDNFIWKKVFK